jgi:hypothetical protein
MRPFDVKGGAALSYEKGALLPHGPCCNNFVVGNRELFSTADSSSL